MPKLHVRRKPETILLTPELAAKLLDNNKLNRPLSQPHVSRLVNQIKSGKWKFNGDTIKISADSNVLDGQHRLWAIIESGITVETIIVYGISRDAFATIDTMRKPRSGSDVLSLNGVDRHRKAAAMALTWLIRYRKGTIMEYRFPENRVENSDIERAFVENPSIIAAAEKVAPLRGLINASLMTMLYYVMVNRNAELAERMVETLLNPAGTPMSDPVFRFRQWLTADRYAIRNRDPLMVIALAIKAANLAHKGESVKVLAWRNQGKAAEPFPVLKI